MVGEDQINFTPLIFQLLSHLCNILDRSFDIRMKRKGDIRSPCFNPFSIGILPQTLPFNNSSIDTENMQCRTNFTNLSKKLNRIRIQVRTTKLTLSYAFCISILIPTIPLRPFYVSQNGQSSIFSNRTSQNECRLINFSSKGLRWSAISFEII